MQHVEFYKKSKLMNEKMIDINNQWFGLSMVLIRGGAFRLKKIRFFGIKLVLVHFRQFQENLNKNSFSRVLIKIHVLSVSVRPTKDSEIPSEMVQNALKIIFDKKFGGKICSGIRNIFCP